MAHLGFKTTHGGGVIDKFRNSHTPNSNSHNNSTNNTHNTNTSTSSKYDYDIDDGDLLTALNDSTSTSNTFNNTSNQQSNYNNNNNNGTRAPAPFNNPPLFRTPITNDQFPSPNPISNAPRPPNPYEDKASKKKVNLYRSNNNYGNNNYNKSSSYTYNKPNNNTTAYKSTLSTNNKNFKNNYNNDDYNNGDEDGDGHNDNEGDDKVLNYTISSYALNKPTTPTKPNKTSPKKPASKRKQQRIEFPDDAISVLDNDSIIDMTNGNDKKVKKIKTKAMDDMTSNFPAPMDDPFPEIDEIALNHWIYPTNFPKRQYQFSITEKALYNNTLVCLATSLGKTFIAAVVMYNYYRWFPKGRVVFMAHSKQLVTQQMNACFTIMGVPQEDTIELTGNKAANKRKDLWNSKRVFFITPQVLEKDLDNKVCDPRNFVCVVIDEAHKAQGEYAYCKVIRQLAAATRHFRVLALSATPGATAPAVQGVINNLLISQMEVRDYNHPEVAPYFHTKDVDEIIVPLGGVVSEIKKKVEALLALPLNKLAANGAYTNKNMDKISPYMLKEAKDRVQDKFMKNMWYDISAQFMVAIKLSTAHGALVKYGIDTFKQKLLDISLKASEKSQSALKEIINSDQWKDLNTMIEKPDTQHPKIEKLVEILLKHFEDHKDTKVMVFSQFRDSVNEIVQLLANYSPRIYAMPFVGQSSTKSKGLSIKEQTRIVQDFRAGKYNVLVSTCVGEEGMDIGEVDLIVCFDAQQSPIRMVQRMGRTGRKRKGRCVMLLSEGSEEISYRSSLKKEREALALLAKRDTAFTYFDENPQMIPKDYSPEVLEKRLDPQALIPVAVPETKKKLGKKDPLMNHEQLEYLYHKYGADYSHAFPPKKVGHSTPTKAVKRTPTLFPTPQVNAYSSLQSTPSPVHLVSHSRLCNVLIEGMQAVQGIGGTEDTLNPPAKKQKLITGPLKADEDSNTKPTSPKLNKSPAILATCTTTTTTVPTSVTIPTAAVSSKQHDGKPKPPITPPKTAIGTPSAKTSPPSIEKRVVQNAKVGILEELDLLESFRLTVDTNPHPPQKTGVAIASLSAPSPQHVPTSTTIATTAPVSPATPKSPPVYTDPTAPQVDTIAAPDKPKRTKLSTLKSSKPVLAAVPSVTAPLRSRTATSQPPPLTAPSVDLPSALGVAVVPVDAPSAKVGLPLQISQTSSEPTVTRSKFFSNSKPLSVPPTASTTKSSQHVTPLSPILQSLPPLSPIIPQKPLPPLSPIVPAPTDEDLQDVDMCDFDLKSKKSNESQDDFDSSYDSDLDQFLPHLPQSTPSSSPSLRVPDPPDSCVNEDKVQAPQPHKQQFPSLHPQLPQNTPLLQPQPQQQPQPPQHQYQPPQLPKPQQTQPLLDDFLDINDSFWFADLDTVTAKPNPTTPDPPQTTTTNKAFTKLPNAYVALSPIRDTAAYPQLDSSDDSPIHRKGPSKRVIATPIKEQGEGDKAETPPEKIQVSKARRKLQISTPHTESETSTTITPVPKKRRKIIRNADDSFETMDPRRFIEDEADVSGEASSDEESGEYDASFMDDESILNDSSMDGVYLRSLSSQCSPSLGFKGSVKRFQPNKHKMVRDARTPESKPLLFSPDSVDRLEDIQSPGVDITNRSGLLTSDSDVSGYNQHNAWGNPRRKLDFSTNSTAPTNTPAPANTNTTETTTPVSYFKAPINQAPNVNNNANGPATINAKPKNFFSNTFGANPKSNLTQSNPGTDSSNNSKGKTRLRNIDNFPNTNFNKPDSLPNFSVLSSNKPDNNNANLPAPSTTVPTPTPAFTTTTAPSTTTTAPSTTTPLRLNNKGHNTSTDDESSPTNFNLCSQATFQRHTSDFGSLSLEGQSLDFYVVDDDLAMFDLDAVEAQKLQQLQPQQPQPQQPLQEEQSVSPGEWTCIILASRESGTDLLPLLRKKRCQVFDVTVANCDYIIGASGVCAICRSQGEVANGFAKLVKAVTQLREAYKDVYFIIEDRKDWPNQRSEDDLSRETAKLTLAGAIVVTSEGLADTATILYDIARADGSKFDFKLTAEFLADNSEQLQVLQATDGISLPSALHLLGGNLSMEDIIGCSPYKLAQKASASMREGMAERFVKYVKKK